MSKRQAMTWWPALLVLVAAGAPARAEVKVPAAFGDHMVLQQGVAVPVWGTAAPGEQVTVKFRGQEVQATAGKDGKWQVKLEAMKATPKQKGTELVVAGAKNSVTFQDVLVGEVWLCSGQSNMEW